MNRLWQPGRDVRGVYLYMQISDSVRLIKRRASENSIRWLYEIHAWDNLTQQYAPYRVKSSHTATTAVAAAKELARSLGEETAAVR